MVGSDGSVGGTSGSGSGSGSTGGVPPPPESPPPESPPPGLPPPESPPPGLPPPESPPPGLPPPESPPPESPPPALPPPEAPPPESPPPALSPPPVTAPGLSPPESTAPELPPPDDTSAADVGTGPTGSVSLQVPTCTGPYTGASNDPALRGGTVDDSGGGTAESATTATDEEVASFPLDGISATSAVSTTEFCVGPDADSAHTVAPLSAARTATPNPIIVSRALRGVPVVSLSDSLEPSSLIAVETAPGSPVHSAGAAAMPISAAATPRE